MGRSVRVPSFNCELVSADLYLKVKFGQFEGVGDHLNAFGPAAAVGNEFARFGEVIA